MVLAVNDLDNFIGKKIKGLREKHNWPLKTLADQLTISIQQLQRYEQGINKISASLLFQVSQIFQVNLTYFFEEYLSGVPSENNEEKIYNVLLVEDDPNDEFLLRTALANFPEKLNIYTLHDGTDALTFFRNLSMNEPVQLPRPDLIFMDLHLPNVKGFELLEDLKRRKNLQNIPVIVLTNSLSSNMVKESYALQASGFIRKSFSFNEFQDQLHRALAYWTETVLLPEKQE